MPVAGKSIAECLQALGVLDERSGAQTRTQWPQNAKILNEAMAEFADSIEEESDAHGAGESPNKWVEERATEWVQSDSELWSAKDRLLHAPAFPRDISVTTIGHWVRQYVLKKWCNASLYRKKKETTTALPGLHFHGSTAAQSQHEDILSASVQDIKKPSQARSEHPDLDEWGPYTDSESDRLSSESAPAPNSNPWPNLRRSTSSAIVPFNGSNPRASHASNDRFQNCSSNASAANDFRSRRSDPVTFEADMYSRITFLIGPSHNGNGHMSNSYARIMGLEEAQKAETFRVDVFERLGEMGEIVGSRKLVAKPNWMPMPFVIHDDHDHHYSFEILRTWDSGRSHSVLSMSV